MSSLFRIFPPKYHTLFQWHIPLPLFLHTSTQFKQIITNDTPTIAISNSILDSLHRGTNWDSLTQKFSSVKLTEPIVQTILLQLKEPINSRKALSLFHWSSKVMNFRHGIFSYCMAIHILVKGRLTKDAKALLETILTKASCDSKSRLFAVLDCLIDTYDLVDSIPFVFDLCLTTCAKFRMFDDDMIDACKLLYDRGFSLNVTTFNSLLHVMQKSGKTRLVWGVYRRMIESRVYPNELTTRIMVSDLCKEGKLEKFLDIVDRTNGKRGSSSELIVNTCLVYELIEEDRIEEGLLLLNS